MFDCCAPITAVPVVQALLLIVFVGICIYVKKKRDDQSRLGKFLADYEALKPARFSYADIKRITGQFKHILGEGAHGTVFKGKLSSEVQVAVKVLNNNDRKDFINEVGTMGKIHHINGVRLLGFCAEGLHCALVYDFFLNGSL
ncbi:rust resistance kinase Lr10-like [Neltuma alba]|uniref:rust resistance kinase Lr10-like n=1 Tax=Neltuma alba TaxID=207710 RepID=UPI0010A5134B|nr:rust resistance kinase Lr10-like [Prosopis alba]